MKKIAFGVVALSLTVAALALAVSGCGAEWAVCESCKPGEEAAQSSDGGQIPIVVNIDVNVDVDVNQTQNQSQNQGGCTTCPPVSVVDAGTPDAGLRDAGTPPVVDAGCPQTCRQVCTKWEWKQHCDRGWHRSSCRHHNCHPKPKIKVCVKEVTQCS